MKTRSNMPLFVLEVSDVKALSNSQINLLRCGDWLVKKDASGEHPYQVTFKKEGVGMCLTYHDASVIETQSYDWNGSQHKWVYNSEDKTELPVNEGDLVVDDLEVNGDAKLFENIVDKNGNKRFIEGAILRNENTPEGMTFTYAKWSLSGTHLMFVIAGTVADETVIPNSAIAEVTLPDWIFDKIYPVWANYIETKQCYLYSSDFSSQTTSVFLQKTGSLIRFITGSLTLTKERTFRVQFDLLIDDE